MSTQTKQQAIDLLDKAIAHINQYGFDISVYGNAAGPCCYIGTLRVADNIPADPPEKVGEWDWHTLPAGEGSPALRQALNVLDHLAEPLLRSAYAAQRLVHYKAEDETVSIGRIIETYGFQCRGTYSGSEYKVDDETKEALSMLRKAKETLVNELADTDMIISSGVENSTRELVTV